MAGGNFAPAFSRHLTWGGDRWHVALSVHHINCRNWKPWYSLHRCAIFTSCVLFPKCTIVIDLRNKKNTMSIGTMELVSFRCNWKSIAMLKCYCNSVIPVLYSDSGCIFFLAWTKFVQVLKSANLMPVKLFNKSQHSPILLYSLKMCISPFSIQISSNWSQHSSLQLWSQVVICILIFATASNVSKPDFVILH